jgi:ankyrin repeat protein
VIQDEDGDTPLHIAISTGNKSAVDILVAQKNINFLAINNRGFNVLHHAALGGDHEYVNKFMLFLLFLVKIRHMWHNISPHVGRFYQFITY